MVVVAGIDEAGYGPLLGPLVVSTTAFRVRGGRDAADLWQVFRAAVARNGSDDRSRLRVADSKALYRRGQGLRVLEENLLPFIGLLCPLPKSVRSFMNRLSSQDVESLSAYPWYRESDPRLPRVAKPESVCSRAQALRQKLAAAGGEFCAARIETLNVAQFNREVEQCENKAVALARRVSELMTYLWERFGEEGIRLIVDKQGGRKRYHSLLRATFPDCRIAADLESEARSEYRVWDEKRRMHVSFEANADARQMSTALASMLSKYTRELFIGMLNEFWVERVPGLRPTAGYVSDGRRFLSQIEHVRRAERIPLELLARRR